MQTTARSTALRVGLLFGPVVFGVTAAGVALPRVGAALGAAPDAVAWVLTAHALALGLGTAVAGRLADTYGIRPVLRAGSLLLVIGALACLWAPELGVVVAGRLLLAAGSGAAAASAGALLAAVSPAYRPRVLATYGMVIAAFAATATLAGGVVTAWWSWRLALILPLLSVAAVPFCLPLAERVTARRRFDVVGALLVTIVVCPIVVLIQAGTLHLHWAVVCALAMMACAATVLLTRWSARHPSGFLARQIVADSTFWTATTIGVGTFGGLFATMYAAPQLLTNAHGWDALTVGVVLLPGAALGAALSRIIGRLDSRAQRRLLAGCAAAAGLALFSAASGAAWTAVIAAWAVLAAFAVTQVTLTGLLSAKLPPSLRGSGLGLLNLTCFVGGAAGSALAAALAHQSGPALSMLVVALFPLAAAALAMRRLS
ncbi:MFS transporter [Micromonospora sp. URMC 106]